MKKSLFLLVTALYFLSNAGSVFSQYLPVITNEQGDTVRYTWPIPDSLLCIKDEIIIKFRSSALFLNKLCYTYQGPPTIPESDTNPFTEFKNEIMNQEFPIDISNLILGIYFVQIKQSNKIEHSKLIITK